MLNPKESSRPWHSPGKWEVNELASAPPEESEGPSSTQFLLKACPKGEFKTMALWPDQPEKMVQLATDLPESMEAALFDFLRENEDVFTWTPSDL